MIQGLNQGLNYEPTPGEDAAAIAAFNSTYETQRWNMQSNASGVYPNQVGTATLADDGDGAELAAAATDLDAGGVCWKAAGASEAACSLVCSDASVGDVGTALAVRVVFKGSWTTSLQKLISKTLSVGSGDEGWMIYTNTAGRLQVNIANNSGGRNIHPIADGGMGNNDWHAVDVYINGSGDALSVKYDGVEVVSAVSIATSTGDRSYSGPLAINTDGSNSGGLDSLSLRYLGLCEGADASLMYAESYWT